MLPKKTNDFLGEIAEIRRQPASEMRAHERRQRVTESVIQNLKNTGVFFRAPDGYFYFEKGQTPKLLPLERDSVALSAFIQERFGINDAERREYEHLITGLRNEALLRGESVEIQKLAHYQADTGRLYISRFNGWVYCLNGRQIRQVPNGTHGIFFWDDPRWQPYEIVRNKRPEGLFDRLVADSANFGETNGLSVDDQRWIFSVWLRSLFFASLLPTKVLVLICGEKGGGKTLALRKWLKLLFGNDAEVTALERSKPDGFVAAVCSLPVAVFDNVDEHVSWLADHLAQLATGVSFKRRKYYTTNEQVEYKPRCSVALTSRTPKFIEGRDDVLDRMLVLQTQRRPKFNPEQAQLAQISKMRNLLWTELLRDLNRILNFVRRPGHDDEALGFRMADFASFAIAVAGAEGQPNRATRILGCLEARRAEMLMLEEPISICLETWLVEPSNRGKQVTSRELNDELQSIARQTGTPWPYTGGQSLGQRLPHITASLRQRFVVQTDQDSANQIWYRFWPRG